MHRARFAHWVILLFIFLGSVHAEAASRSLQKIFTRPLIIGASVSSGLLVEGPGTIATRAVMGSDTSLNIARNGAQGRYFQNINGESLKEYSLVIGVDFVFWDSINDDVTESLTAIQNLIRSAQQANVPLVLGDVPALSSRQNESSRRALNQRIRSLCRPKNGCRLLPLDRIHEIANGPGLVIEGQVYHYSDLTIDGIHLNLTGSRYLAGQILEIL